MAAHAPPEVIAAVGKEIGLLAEAAYGKNSPKVGASLPDFALPDVHGKKVKLSELLAKGPVVLAFYRGGWCPFCNLQLRAYQKILPQIRSLGASLVAISPTTPDNSLSFAEKAELTFPVLSDVGNNVARAYGLTFKLSDGLQKLQSGFGNPIPKFNGDESWELPVPATFVADRHGVVRFAHFDPNWTKRVEPATILSALQAIQK